MNEELVPNTNTGFLEVMPQPGDFIAGAETGILDTPVLPSSDWKPYLPTNSLQLMMVNGLNRGDTNACVSFAAGQSVETQLNFQIKTGKVSAENLAWLTSNGYIDSTGSVYVSKRYIATMSGTNPAVGNSLPAVWQSIVKNGVVPDSVWPMPTSQFDALPESATIQELWNIYYTPVSQPVQALGTEFAARFPVLYEWLVYPGQAADTAQLLEDLTVSPMEIATAVCAGWNTEDPIQACGPGSQHATMLDFIEANGDYDILDHYVPYNKQFSPTYSITYAMRGVVGQTLSPAPPTFTYVFTEQLTYGSAHNDPVQLKALQEALQFLKNKSGQPYMKPGVFGPFGPQTAAALAQFESDNDITDPEPGHNFGPQNRVAINAALAG